MQIFVLDTTTKSIKAEMAGAATTTNPDFVVSFADKTSTAFTESVNDGALDNTSPVTIVSAPSASVRRIVRDITIYNRDTSNNTITINYDNNGTLRTIAKVTLAPSESWTLDGVFDDEGSQKINFESNELSNVAYYASDTSNNAYAQANTARDQANTARGQANTAYAQANAAYADANTRVLKAGDTMTGNLIVSGATINTSTANISTLVTGNILTLSTGTGSNSNVVISANGSEIVRMTNTGNVGIGTTSPTSKLHIVGLTTIEEIIEKANITSTAMGANSTIDVLDCAVHYYTANSTANTTLNIRGNSTVTLNSVMSTNQTLTLAFMITNGTTPYRVANVQLDAVNTTIRWADGSTPTASANSTEVYGFTVIKTADNAQYTLLGVKSRFAAP